MAGTDLDKQNEGHDFCLSAFRFIAEGKAMGLLWGVGHIFRFCSTYGAAPSAAPY